MSARNLLITVALTALAPAAAPGAIIAGESAVVPAPHTRLVSSEPGEDDTLSARPERIRLVFSGPVNASLSTVGLTGPGGRDLTFDAEEDPETVNALLVELGEESPRMTSGSYRVSWRTVSADGHTVSGQFSFVLTLPEPATPAAAEEVPVGGDGREGDSGEGDGSVVPGPRADARVPAFAASLRAVGDGLLLAFAGLALFLGWLTPGAGSRPARLARGLAFVTPVALILSFGAWAASVVPGDMSVSAMAATLETLPGRLGGIRIGLALLAVAALTATGSLRAAAVLALGAVLVGSGVGHAATYEPLWSIPSKAIHLMAVSVWFGGLILLLTDEAEGADFATHAGTVSSAALVAVIAIAVTGLVQTVVMVPGLGRLLGSDWGTVLILKVVGLLVLVGFGAYHRLRVLPRLAVEGGPSLRSSVRWETLVMLAVIVVAAFLSRITPPEAEVAREDAASERMVGG